MRKKNSKSKINKIKLLSTFMHRNILTSSEFYMRYYMCDRCATVTKLVQCPPCLQKAQKVKQFQAMLGLSALYVWVTPQEKWLP